MKLLQDLLSLNEGAMKEAIIALIERAMSHVHSNTGNMDNDIATIVSQVRRLDNRDLTAGSSDEELGEMVKSMLDESDYKMDEAVGGDEEEKMQILSSAAGAHGVKYSVVLKPSAELVQVVDNADRVYLEVPLVIWQQLSRNQG